jgi:tRNA A-37 threonylcarbamoyl transferase component Bud32
VKNVKIYPLSRQKLKDMITTGTVLEQDSHGAKVICLANGNFLKYFRRKRFFNRELISPAAVRFAANVRYLEKFNIPVMRVLALHRIIGEPHTVVVYQPLFGESLRKLSAAGQVTAAEMRQVGNFIAHLHRCGIYFRSLHPGNIVLDGSRTGLIDVLDMRIRFWSLTRWERQRNWLHFLRCMEDRPLMDGTLIDALLAGYHEAADISSRQLSKVTDHVRARLLW